MIIILGIVTAWIKKVNRLSKTNNKYNSKNRE